MSTSASAPKTNGKTEQSGTQKALEEIKRLIAAKYPLLYVVTWEEQRLEQIVKEIAKSAFSTPLKTYIWSRSQGLLNGEGKKVEGGQDPVAAIDLIMRSKEPSLFLMKDLHREMEANATLVRKLRDAYHLMKNSFKTIFISAPLVNIPPELDKDVALVDLPLPTLDELTKLFQSVAASFKNLTLKLKEGEEFDFGKAALGMTHDEAKIAFYKACLGKSQVTVQDIAGIMDEKTQQVQREGILEYVPVSFGIDQVGGLDNLKEWLETRARFFTSEAAQFGIKAPKGVLMTGISGCGKSLCVKAIAYYWKLPLMRLDMTRVYGGIAGNPEESMRRALKTVEAIQPVILWVDEVENAFANDGAGTSNRIFSSFLTWMQERKSNVFIAATANQIDKLPAELMRKGRFDEIFFVDLPTEAERAEIFKVHIRNRNHDPSKFNLVNLAKASNNFNGAEIEQVVVSGMYQAFNEKRPLNEQDLYKTISATVPLATTMSEQMKLIKRWADQRAVRASK